MGNIGIDVIDLHMNGINFANCFCCSAFISIVLVALLMKKTHTSEIRSFIGFTFFTVSSMWTDFISYMCAGKEDFRQINYIVNALSYTFTALAASAFFVYILTYFEERSGIKRNRALIIISYAYAILCSCVYSSSIWTGAFFIIDDTNKYRATELSTITALIVIPIVLANIFVIIKNRRLTSRRDTIIHFLYNISGVVLGYIDSAYVFTLRYIVTAVLVVLIYIFISIERDKELDNKEKELAISELNALRLQMNPHFIYNTLASIDGLVVIDPSSARSLIAKFTKHLRSSYLDNSPSLVSFESELENIKCYLSVEEVRFPNISIEYDLGITDFSIPPLTVQPIIENAIKHGICKRDDGAGTITISTYDDKNNYYIKIIDNGVGFDPNAPKKADGRTHIGISNTEKRLELICGGALSVTSQIGIGTQAVITVPKEKV